ncbi:MAG: ATPase [Desulfobacterota bacterium]|nr:ATPase [Thermodesulfobacteriota bacterium]
MDILATVGLGLMIAGGGAGSAIGLAISSSAFLGLLKKKPELFGTGLALVMPPATQGLYGFVAFVLYKNYVTADLTVFQGSLILAAGIGMFFPCLLSAIWQGKVCADGIAATAQGKNVFGITMMLAAFPEFYAILSLVGAILLMPLLRM